MISDQLGHASVQITMDRYSHLFDGAYSDVNDELEQAWRGAEVTHAGPRNASRIGCGAVEAGSSWEIAGTLGE